MIPVSVSSKNVKKSYIQTKAILKSNRKISDSIYEMTIHCPEIASSSIPGQFISILCDNTLLRRPFSIADADSQTLQIIYKLKGHGTLYMSKLAPGEHLNILGPLGNGFSTNYNKALLIGAGVGIAPLIYLSKILMQKNIDVYFMTGLQSKIDLSNPYTNNILTITEDGSSVQKGLITEYIENAIKIHKPDIIYSCGPNIVLKNVVSFANKYHIDTELALEEKFACGTGVCMGCIINIKENNKVINKRICKDGPIFKGDSIAW
ncbi:MAG: dihydroorotate dehydrogenase electron transfer subunit [Cyanobacteriota bacterium]